MRDGINNIGAVTALSPEVITNAAINGAIIDTSGFASLAFIVTAGTITDGTYAATLIEGNDSALADGSAVAAGDILGTLPAFVATDDNVTRKVGYLGVKRYVRLVMTPSSATTGGLFSAVAVKGWASVAPVA